jgi:hypothetical protein
VEEGLVYMLEKEGKATSAWRSAWAKMELSSLRKSYKY